MKRPKVEKLGKFSIQTIKRNEMSDSKRFMKENWQKGKD